MDPSGFAGSEIQDLATEVDTYIGIPTASCDTDLITFWQVYIIFILIIIYLQYMITRKIKITTQPYLSLQWILSPFKLLQCPVKGCFPLVRRPCQQEEMHFLLIL